jgi:hypothetical protein
MTIPGLHTHTRTQTFPGSHTLTERERERDFPWYTHTHTHTHTCGFMRPSVTCSFETLFTSPPSMCVKSCVLRLPSDARHQLSGLYTSGSCQTRRSWRARSTALKPTTMPSSRSFPIEWGAKYACGPQEWACVPVLCQDSGNMARLRPVGVRAAHRAHSAIAGHEHSARRRLMHA